MSILGKVQMVYTKQLVSDCVADESGSGVAVVLFVQVCNVIFFQLQSYIVQPSTNVSLSIGTGLNMAQIQYLCRRQEKGIECLPLKKCA